MNYKILSLAIIATTALSAEYIMKQNVGSGIVFNTETAQPGTYNSCQAAYNAGLTTDGIYSIDIDGEGGSDPIETVCDMTNFNGGWTQCFEFTNTSAEDLTGNNWFDRCVTVSNDDDFGNSIMVKLTNNNGEVAYNAWGAFTKNWNNNQITSTTGTTSQYSTDQHGRKISLNNGHYLSITGKNSGNNGCAGSLGNGYGIMIKNASTGAQVNSILNVFPYRHTNSSYSNYNGARLFSGWSTSKEISYGSSAWSTCSSVPGFLGKFEVFIK